MSIDETMIDYPAIHTDQVRIAVTNRSLGNLAYHVGDDAALVSDNRHTLASAIGQEPIWLQQTHSDQVLKVKSHQGELTEADASFTTEANVPLAIMTADCVPIMLWHNDGNQIAAVHAGWRGLVNGIIKNTIQQFNKGAPASDLCAYIGPAIGACHYEVDDAVKMQFGNTSAFTEGDRVGHYWFDLAAEAYRQLAEAGVTRVIQSKICTACDERYYSYRQEGETGRFATLIWRV